ncbi:MAG: PD-(D/E)XK nuclease family protein, partial [Pseudobdellovibrionaceae bacterium]
IQNADFYEFVEKERKRSKAEVENLKNSFANDWGHAPIPAFAPSEAWRLSASSLETYLDCPFKFAAGKVFGLLDEPTLDLDLDKRTKGQIGHLLFERILSGEDLSSWNAEKIAAILEMEFQEKRILLSDSRLWQKIKNRHVILGLRFVEFEKEWRKRFPQTKTVGREVSFRGFLDPDGNWHVEPGPGTTEFTGKIDRIDEDGNKRKAVIDYKSSQFGITPFQNWFKDRALQLALYTMIVETGLAEGLERSQVIAALYFNFRNFDRDLGFKIVDAVGSLYDLEGKRKRAHHISEAERESEFAKLKTLIVEAVQNIKKGQFQPVPLDEKQCEYCNWSGLCRSPHLNS